MDQKYWQALNKHLPKEANCLFRGWQRSLGWVVLLFFIVVPCLLPTWIVFYRHCRIEEEYKSAWTNPSHHYQLLPPSLLLLFRKCQWRRSSQFICSQVLQHLQDVWSPFLPHWSLSSLPLAWVVLFKILLLSWEHATYSPPWFTAKPYSKALPVFNPLQMLQRASRIFSFAEVIA